MTQTTAAEIEFSLKDGVRELLSDIAVAQAAEDPDDKFVEADARVIKHFQKSGVGETGYFWYQGVKVYEKGRKAAVDERDALTADQVAFGKKAA